MTNVKRICGKFQVWSNHLESLQSIGMIGFGDQDRWIGYCSIKEGKLLNSSDLFKELGEAVIALPCASIYEAIPELIPDGMRYNKELDKLVPDIINIEFEKVKFDDFVDNHEQILKRENGFIKADKKKINFSLVDPYAYEDLGKCLTIGAEKYDPDNWKLGDIESYISALDRHLLDIKKAVADKDKSLFIDKDTTLQHGANLLCNAMFLHYFIRKELEEK